MGTRNKLSDLNNLLFEQLERLNDDEIVGDDLTEEIERSKAFTSVAKTIIENANLSLNAQKHMDEFGYGAGKRALPKVFEIENKE